MILKSHVLRKKISLYQVLRVGGVLLGKSLSKIQKKKDFQSEGGQELYMIIFFGALFSW